MSHLITALVRADLRSAPGRVVATTALLIAAGLVGVTGHTGPLTTGLLTGAIAAAAAAGVVAASGRRAEVLDRNGSGTSTLVAVAVAALALPALLATTVSLTARAGLTSTATGGEVVFAVLVCPLLAAAVTAVVSTPPMLDRSPGRTWGVPLVVVAAVVLPTVVLPVIAARVAWRQGPIGRMACVLGAAAMVGGLAFLAGSVGSWVDLTVVLLLFGPPAAVGVAILGVAALHVTATVVGALGPIGRLAAAPLQRQRAVVGPLVGVVAVVTSLGALDATVGASFGEREARRQETLPTRSLPAGSSDDQVIATLRRVDGDAARLIAAEAAAGTGTRAVVIDQVGGGGAPVRHASAGGFLDFAVPLTVTVGTSYPSAPGWLGVVAPEDLALLGLGDHAADLAAGRVVVVNPDLLGPGAEEVSIVVSDGPELDAPASLPAVAVDAERVGVALPGAVVSPAVADTLGQPTAASRLVVVPDRPGPEGDAAARAVVADVLARVESVPLLPALEDDAATTVATILQSTSTLAGGDRVVQWESGALNEVPVFASTAEQGRDRLVTWGALALLVTLAATALALGATRADDAVVSLQGAPPRFRTALGGVQAAVIAGTAAGLAAVVGIVLPRYAFTLFATHSEQPEIPLVVPVAVPVLLIGLPLVAAALSALLIALRGDLRREATILADELTW